MLKYKGLHGIREHMKVTDEIVDSMIDSIIEQNPRVIPVTDRPAQAGDELLLDYSGEVGGNYFEGGTAEKQTLTLGSGAFIPGFEDQLIGHKPGGRVDVRVTFPDPYHAPELAGKEAVFHCVVHEIRLKEQYEANDTFAKEYAGVESLSVLREQIRAEQQAYVDGKAEEELRDMLINQVCESGVFEIDENQLEKVLDEQLSALEAQLGQRGLTLELYAQFTGSTKEKLREDYRPEARRSIERQLAIFEIAKTENIEADEISVAQALETICRENGLTIEQLMPHVDDAFRKAVEQSVIMDKALDFIVKHATIETVEK